MKLKIGTEATCRICFESGDDLIAPCNCTGSVRYVHSDCLKTWILLSQDLQNTKCEICNAPFSIAVEYKKSCQCNLRSDSDCYQFALPVLLLGLQSVLYLIGYFLFINMLDEDVSVEDKIYSGILLCICLVSSIILISVTYYSVKKLLGFKLVRKLKVFPRSTLNTNETNLSNNTVENANPRYFAFGENLRETSGFAFSS